MSQTYIGLDTGPDPNSNFSGRKKFSANKFGYIPKSDTFQYLTVSDKLNERKDTPNCYEIANQAKVGPNETQKFQVPQRSIIVKFHLYQHLDEDLGTYQICLPKAIPGLKIKVIFDAYLKMVDYPKEIRGQPITDPFKSSGWPTTPTTDPAYDDEIQYDGNRIRVNSQKIKVKCMNSDLFRGFALYPLEHMGVTYHGNHLLPFEVGGEKTIVVDPDVTTMEQILASHAELECIIPGQWLAKFYGVWS